MNFELASIINTNLRLFTINLIIHKIQEEIVEKDIRKIISSVPISNVIQFITIGLR